MGFGSEMVTAWQQQVRDDYLNLRISNIEGADSWVTLRLGRSKEWLFLSWDHSRYGCCTSSQEKVRALSSSSRSRPPLLSALKKHLNGATLIDVAQINSDRVLAFRFSKRLGAGRDQLTVLILEATDRFSNLILADADNIVIETAHHVHPDVNRYRSILPGQPYVPPPPFSGRALEDFPEVFHPDLIKDLRGIGKHLARNLKGLWEPGDTSWKEPLRKILAPQTGNHQCQTLGGYITTWPTLLPGAIPLAGKALQASAAGVIDPLVAINIERVRKKIGKGIQEELHRVSRRLSGMRERLFRGEKAALWNHQGELLLAYPHLLGKATHNQVEIPDWESGENLVVEVDPGLDAVANAKKYFARAKKARPHVVKARAEARQLEQKEEEIRTDLFLLEKVNDPEALTQFGRDRLPHKERPHRKRGGKKETPSHLRYDLEQCVLFVGLSAKGNRYVTFELASADDIWFHAQGIPGSHVILKAPLPEIPEKVFLAAASLSAYYSRSDNEGDLIVDYTERRHVRHISGSGPANVTFKRFSSIRIDQNLWRKILQEETSSPREEGF